MVGHEPTESASSSTGTPETPAVVVPAIATGSSITAVRSLGRHGVRPLVLGNTDSAVARSKYCSEVIEAPSPAEDLRGYRDALLGVTSRPRVKTVVPLREPDVYVLSKFREQFANRIATPWPDFETVQNVQDRYELLNRARSVGAPIPRTELLTEWPRTEETTVVKSRYAITESENGTQYSNVRVVSPGEDPAVEQTCDEMGHVPLAQEYIPGDVECGFFALCDSGTPVVTFQHKRIRSYSYNGGASVFRKSTRIPELAELGSQLLSDLDWHGPAMVEFKYDPRDETYKLMEINPRFWGSLALPVAAGVDFPSLYYRLATGDTPEQPPYDTDIGCHILRGEASYLYSLIRDNHAYTEKPNGLSALGAVVTSILTDRNFDYLQAADPVPFLYDTVGALRGET